MPIGNTDKNLSRDFRVIQRAMVRGATEGQAGGTRDLGQTIVL
jgi:hypothetical protein